MRYKKTKNYISSSIRNSKKNIKLYKNVNLIGGGGIDTKIFNKIKQDLKEKMIKDVNILKKHTDFKTKENIESFFENIEQLVKDIKKSKPKSRKNIASNKNNSMASVSASVSASASAINNKKLTKKIKNKKINEEKEKFKEDIQNAGDNINKIIELYKTKNEEFDEIIFREKLIDNVSNHEIAYAESKGKFLTSKKQNVNNIPYFFNDISNDTDIIIWIIIQYISDFITINDFFDDSLKSNIANYLNLKGKTINTKKLQLSIGITSYNINKEDNVMYLFKSIIKGNKINYTVNSYDLLIDYLKILPVYETENLLIYKPETLKEAIYVGTNTVWCTSSISKENMFENYMLEKKLIYTIIIKKINERKMLELNCDRNLYNCYKFQFALKTKEFMNNNNNTIDTLILHILYPDINNYFASINKDLFENIFIDNNYYDFFINYYELIKLNIKTITFEICQKNILKKEIIHLENLEKLIISKYNIIENISCKNLKNLIFNNNGIPYKRNLVYNFINIEELNLGHIFNQPLDNSLDELKNLTTLTFGNMFNQPLYNSLDELQNLTNLTFGNMFNQPLYNSLDKLKKLTTLSFGYDFNQLLGNSLHELKNLTTLTFELDFNQPLGNSLEELKNLTTLIFSSMFNQSLGNSLYELKNLTTLTFNDNFNKPLGNSLDKLKNLTTLNFGYLFNQKLGNSLDKLNKLTTLSFNNFNKPLGNSLDKLNNLKTLILNNDFNQPLGNSLDKLTKLKKISFPTNFNQPLGNSLHNLINLEDLLFGYNFNQPLGNSLDKLENLQNLLFGYNFNQPLSNSLDKLTNLKELLFGYNFNQPLSNSLDKLTNLKIITLNVDFNQKLSNSLDNLVNLEQLILYSTNYDIPLGNSLNKLTKLEILYLYYYNKPLGNSLDKLTNLKYIIYNGEINEILSIMLKLKNLLEFKKKIIYAYEKHKFAEFKKLHNLNVKFIRHYDNY